MVKIWRAGNIKSLASRTAGSIVKYFDMSLPIDPQTIPLIFAPVGNLHAHEQTQWHAVAELESLLNAFGRLPDNDVTDPDEVRRRQNEMPPLLEQAAAALRLIPPRCGPSYAEALRRAQRNSGRALTASTRCMNCWRNRRTGWRSGECPAKKSTTGGSSTSTIWSGCAWRIRASLRRRTS